MVRCRGFTLVEMMVVVAMIAVVATTAIVTLRAARRNALVGSVTFDLIMKLQGIGTKALAEQRDHLAVFHDGDGSGCNTFNASGCVRVFVLAGPQATWKLQGFSSATPADLVQEVVEVIDLPQGVTFHGSAAVRGKAPFTNVVSWDGALTTTCGGPRCVAFRFQADGQVRGETPAGNIVRRPGNIVALATDIEGQTSAAERRAVLVAFPSGIVNSFTY